MNAPIPLRYDNLGTSALCHHLAFGKTADYVRLPHGVVCQSCAQALLAGTAINSDQIAPVWKTEVDGLIQVSPGRDLTPAYRPAIRSAERRTQKPRPWRVRLAGILTRLAGMLNPEREVKP